MPKTYINTTCKVGQSEPCGKEATYVIAVTAIADTAWATEGREGGVVPMCDFHARTAVSEWDATAAKQRAHGDTGGDDGEVGK